MSAIDAKKIVRNLRRKKPKTLAVKTKLGHLILPPAAQWAMLKNRGV